MPPMVTSGLGLVSRLGPGVSDFNWSQVMKKIIRFLQDESGATAIEYGLLAALIAVAIIGAVTTLGDTLETRFRTIASAIESSS